MIQKQLLWVEVGKVLVCLWGFANGASLCLLDMALELELELIQTRMIQKPLLWVERGKVLVCLWGFANCASLCLLDMTRPNSILLGSHLGPIIYAI